MNYVKSKQLSPIIAVMLCGAVCFSSSGAWSSDTPPSVSAAPMVIFLHHPGSSLETPDFVVALQAHLASSRVVLKEKLASPQLDEDNRALHLQRVLNAYGPDIIFWIEEGPPCRVFFYVPHGPQRQWRLISRQILFENTKTDAFRSDTLAIAISGWLEALWISLPPPRVLAEPKKETTQEKQKNDTTHTAKPAFADITLRYSGELIGRRCFFSGAALGMNIFPRPHFFLGVMLSLNRRTTYHTDDDEFSLRLSSRSLATAFGGRWGNRSHDFRAGFRWILDSREHSVVTLSDSIHPLASGNMLIHSIGPTVSWSVRLYRRFWLVSEMMLKVSLNETTYQLQEETERYDVFRPYRAKFLFQLGINVPL